MKDFKNPERFYRGTDFWMLNDTLSEDEIARQLAEMAKKGVASVICRTYIGLKSDYPGKDFMQKTRVMINEAKKNGMTVFLQAGYMPEAVLGLPKEYALDYLCIGSAEHPVFEGVNDIWFPEADDPKNAKDLLTKNGYEYKALNSLTCLDLFNPDSVDWYIRQSYDLWQEFSDEFGKTVNSIWVDEPSYRADFLPWSDFIDRTFRDTYGYDLKEKVNCLYFDDGDYKQVRYDYWTLLQKWMEKAYFQKIAAWCKKNHLNFSGHLMTEDALHRCIRRACAVMPYYKYFDIPGIDILSGDMRYRNDPIENAADNEIICSYTTPKQMVSAAHQAGKKYTLCEMYGVTTNGMGFRDFEHYFDHFASLGINYRSVHGIFYSLHGRAKRTYPPHVNYYQPYFEKYNDVTDYCARTAAFLSQGKPQANVLVVHPLESAYLLAKGLSVHGSPFAYTEGEKPIYELDLHYNTLTRALCVSGFDWELGDLNTLSTDMSRVEGTRYHVGEMTYGTVVLPYLEVLNRKTAEDIRAFLQNGGKVFVVGRYPTRLDGKEENVREKYLAGAVFCEDTARLCEYLNDARMYTLKSDGDKTQVRVYHTALDGERYYMLYNADCRYAHKVSLAVGGNFTALLCDAQSGATEALPTSFDGSETTVSLTLSEGGSALICLAESDEKKRFSEWKAKPYSVLPLSDCFKIERSTDNVAVLEFCRYKTEQMKEFEGEYTTLAINRILTDAEYEGDLIQEFSFESKKAFSSLSLALEDAHECEVYLNGEKARDYDGKSYYFAKSFEVVRLPDACRVGKNVLTVRRRFRPLTKAKSDITSLFECQTGTELENMYLLGDFGVYGTPEQTFSQLIRFNRRFMLDDLSDTASGELTRDGYAFYVGNVLLSQKFSFEKKAGKTYLCFGDYHGSVAEVFVNGVSCGDVYKPPYRIEVTKALRDGENTLSVRLYNTLRPILGPYHHPDAEYGYCWGGYGDPDASWTGSEGGADWYKKGELDTRAWSNSYHQVRFGISDLCLVTED